MICTPKKAFHFGGAYFNKKTSVKFKVFSAEYKKDAKI